MKEKLRLSNAISSVRVVLVAIFGAFWCFEPQIVGFIPGILLIAFIFFTDTLDGMVARYKKETSVMGSFYDIVGDRVTETGLLIPFVYLHIASPLLLNSSTPGQVRLG